MQQHPQEIPDRQAPLVLRRMPAERHHLARAMAGPPIGPVAGTWWELVDAAAAGDAQPAGVALVRTGLDGRVGVSALAIRRDDAADRYTELLGALMAELRRHDADGVMVHSTDPAVVDALLTVGFNRAPDGTSRDCFVIAL